MSYFERAEQVLREWVQSEQLRKHCYAVSASMRHFAELQGGDPDLWAAVGLLHDMDFEKHPEMPPADETTAAASRALLQGSPAEPPIHMHPFVGVHHLRQAEWGDDVVRAVLSHADYSGVKPETAMEKTLCAVDELSSFAIAVALVKPTRSIFDVDVKSVTKKMKDKAFARAVSRDDIRHGAELLNMELETLIAHVLDALRADAARLGVAGS